MQSKYMYSESCTHNKGNSTCTGTQSIIESSIDTSEESKYMFLESCTHNQGNSTCTGTHSILESSIDFSEESKYMYSESCTHGGVLLLQVDFSVHPKFSAPFLHLSRKDSLLFLPCPMSHIHFLLS